MSFILVPTVGDDLQVNAWNWRPTLDLLLREALINEKLHDRMGAQSAAAEVDARTAQRFSETIRLTLNEMKPGERILPDLTTTDQPKKNWSIKADTQSDEIDVNDVYSATYEWLVKFAEFCSRSGGFKVV